MERVQKPPEVARFSKQSLETKYSPKRRMQIANRILATAHVCFSLLIKAFKAKYVV